jgi:hypothetical protein
MRLLTTLALLLCGAISASAQLTREQRIIDFQTLAGQFAKRYGPYQWKKANFGVDLLEISPFLDRAAAARDDLEFYEVCIDYVAQLRDAHSFFSLPSDFIAWLDISADLYDGKVIIDDITRSRLPQRQFPFEVGDELVSIDGKPAEEVLQSLTRYTEAANPLSTRRLAAYYLSLRAQSMMPHAFEIGEKARVEIRRQNGEVQTYELPWSKDGVPMTSQGPVPTPKLAPRRQARPRAQSGEPEETPAWAAPLRPLLLQTLPPPKSLVGLGELRPVFAMPPNFQQRLGTNPFTDYFFSGTYTAGGETLGFIRIPDFLPDNVRSAVVQFEREVAYMTANTDGLIVDVMRNEGGYTYYVNEIVRRLVPGGFRTMGYELRATAEMVQMFSAFYELSKLIGAPQYAVDSYEWLLKTVQQSYRENRGSTGPLPLDSIFLSPMLPVPSLDIPPLLDRNGRATAYEKPVMVLIDGLSFSAAESFAAIMQDNQAALIVGARTAGAGGPTRQYDAGAYSEGFIGLTVGLGVRKNPVVTSDYQTAPYVENIGVRPDVDLEYMTRDNLMQRGRTFVEDFTGAFVAYIQGK